MAGAKTTEPADPYAVAEAKIAAKLVAVRQKITHVEKRGRNDHHGYDFATWGDVLQEAREHLNEAGLHLHLSVAECQPIGAGTVQVVLDYRWIDVETGASLPGRWVGTGYDKGDKAVYKAYSGALKYLILDSFLIPTGDDPEAGDEPPADGSAAPQPASRTGAPKIPKARAEKIVAAAKEAGVTQPVFKAKLHDLGFSKVVDLDVDAAEAVEAWIASGGSE